MFFKQIETARDLASANITAYTKAKLTSIVFSLIFQQRVLNDACRTCCHRPAAELTWGNFIVHSTEAHQELAELQAAAQQSAFVASNMAEAEHMSE
eukprot:10052630-Ditylum_brightwellii.AAC.1